MRTGQPELNTGKCTACTACIPACPTSAIQYPSYNADSVLARISELPAAERHNITIHCHAEGSNGMSVHCHAGWHPQHFATLAGMGVASLALSGTRRCDTCPLRFGAQALEQARTAYGELKRAMGVTLDIRLEDVHRSEHAGPKAAPSMPSRRAFFRDIIPAMLTGAAAMPDEMTGRTKAAAAEEGLPARHRLFLGVLKSLHPDFTPVPAGARIGLGAIQADAACTACGACVDTCPAGALEIKPFGQHEVLHFRPDACTGCGLCIECCEPKALQALPAVSLPVIMARQSRPLVMVRRQQGMACRKK